MWEVARCIWLIHKIKQSCSIHLGHTTKTTNQTSGSHVEINPICRRSDGLSCPAQCFEWRWEVTFGTGAGWGLARGRRHPAKQMHGTFTALAIQQGHQTVLTSTGSNTDQLLISVQIGLQAPMVVAAESKERGGQSGRTLWEVKIERSTFLRFQFWGSSVRLFLGFRYEHNSMYTVRDVFFPKCPCRSNKIPSHQGWNFLEIRV